MIIIKEIVVVISLKLILASRGLSQQEKNDRKERETSTSSDTFFHVANDHICAHA